MKALISVAAALGVIEYDEAELARFDRLAEHVKQHGGSLHAASEAIAEPVTTQVIAIVASGHAYNWFDGGADAALSLPNVDEFKQRVEPGDGKHFDLARLAVLALRELAWERVAEDSEHLREAGKALLELVSVTLTADPDRTEVALDLAIASHDLLAAPGDPDAQVAQALAYRLLVWSKGLPFLADMAPCKFPPPVMPRFPSETVLALCLRFVEEGILDQGIDLGATARHMLDDPEAIIWNELVVEIDGKAETCRMETALGPELLRWALDEESEEARNFQVTADDKIRAILQLLCENRALLERHRDDDLSDIYIAAYLGVDPTARTMDLALKTEAVGNIVRCVVGLSEEDVRANSTRDRVFAPLEAALIDHLRASVLQDRRAS